MVKSPRRPLRDGATLQIHRVEAPGKQHVVNARSDGVLSAINFGPSPHCGSVPPFQQLHSQSTFSRPHQPL